MTTKRRGLARRRNVSKSRARKPSKAKQALLKRAQFFKAQGEAMVGAVRSAKAETLLEAAKDAGIAEVKWQQDDDVDTSWMDKKDMEDYRSGRVEYLGCVIEVNGEHCGSLWGIGLLGGRSDPYARVIEAEIASECEDALKAGLRKAQRGARRGLKIKPNSRRGSPRGRRKNSPMVRGSKDLGGRMMEWQSPSEPEVGGVGSHFYAGMPVPMASAEQALRDLKKDATQHTPAQPAANRQHLRKVISDLSKVIAKAKKANPKFRVDFDSPQFGQGGMDVDVTPTDRGAHVDLSVDQHQHRFQFDVAAKQLPAHIEEPEATEATMAGVPESAVVEEVAPETVSNRGRRTKRLGRRSNCGGMKMNPARFRLFDNGGKTADRYSLIDTKREMVGVPGHEVGVRTFFGFNSQPWHPQGIGQHGELSDRDWSQMGNFKHLGKRIGLEDLPDDLQKYISNLIKEWGGDPKSAMRGKHSLKAKRSRKKVANRGRSSRKSTRKGAAGRLYAGPRVDTGLWEVFRSSETPTEKSHRHVYKFVTGPMRTVSEAYGYITAMGGADPNWNASPKTIAEANAAIRQIKARRTNRGRSARKPARRMNRARKSMAEFIRENKDEIDAGIRRALGRPDARLNNEERRQWILNDEGLYAWARSEGVRI